MRIAAAERFFPIPVHPNPNDAPSKLEYDALFRRRLRLYTYCYYFKLVAMDVDGNLLLIVRFLCVFYDSKGLKYNSRGSGKYHLGDNIT